MRLDPKYFNLFVGICAVIGVFVILYWTISHFQGQQESFRENLSHFELSEQKLALIWSGEMDIAGDSLRIGSLEGSPVLIDFWATWSGRSQNNHRLLSEMKYRYPSLTVVAASVRDDRALAEGYIGEHDYDFIFVDGTDLYNALMVPGIPSQILIGPSGSVVDMQVGEDRDKLEDRINRLMEIE